MSLKNTILSVTRRTKNGFTAGEIFDRVQTRFESRGQSAPAYNVVRARIAERYQSGKLTVTDVRPDSVSGYNSATYRRVTSTT